MSPIQGNLLVAFLLLAGPGAAGAQSPCGSWTPAPMPQAAGRGLASVSASSASDAWAVWRGLYHWDGAGWSLVPAPGLGHPDSVLVAVAAVAPGDAWTVGYWSLFGTPQTLVQRWNGSSWSVVPSPVVPGGSQFDGVAAVAPDDVWAVGSRAGGHPEFEATRVTLTAHWDGSTWTRIPSPNISNRSHELLDVTALATDDVWAVGSYRNIGGNYQTLILHWDGSTWAITPSPNFPGENTLSGVSGTAANDVWAVGGAWDGITSKQILLHWDGSSWSQVEGPGGPTACVGCSGDVLALGPDDVWAAGNTIGHWDGAGWTLVPNPDVPGATGLAFRSLAKLGECAAWVVGGSFDSDGTEHALSARLSPGGGTTNLAPIAVAAAEPASGPGPLEVHFSSVGSVDPDGSIVSWNWSFGDGFSSVSNEPNPVHTYLQTGLLTYHALLRVEDDDGAITEASVEVRITPPVHVEEQEVVQAETAGAGGWVGRDVILIADPDVLPVAGATVTAQFSGPASGTVTGTTGADGRVTLETPASTDTTSAWCFTVSKVEKSGFVYQPGANVVTTQCEDPAATVAVESPAGTPFALRVSPNPSSGESVIELTLAARQPVRLAIHDPSGRRVRVLWSAPLDPGEHVFRWDGRDEARRAAGAGVYFVTAKAGERTRSVRLLRTR